ncbi:MAG: HD domain-containing protein [Deltaproteobacteria bacterium]|nr:HD domain-containing protein [Deltaproteobacteria bacterium]
MARAEKIATSSISLLTVGLDPDELNSLSHVFEYCRVEHIDMDLNKLASGAIESAASGGGKFTPDLLICGESKTAVSLDEIAQTIRMTFPNAQMFCVCRNRRNYNRKALVKNGFNDAYLFPMEAGALRRGVFIALNKLTNGIVKAYRPVRMADIRVGAELPCKIAIYLPVNHKYVHFLNEEVIFTGAHLEKLRSHRISSVYVQVEDLPAFYDYATAGTKQVDPAAKMSMTERRHRLEDETRRLLGGMFQAGGAISIEEGQKTVEDLQSAVQRYILDFPPHELRFQILSMMGEMEDSYSHVINTAIYGALFSIALEVGTPADIALAGLLHDIGLVDVPEQVVLKPVAHHNEEDAVLYQKHVDATVAVMKEHKLTVMGPVMKAVYQHHEYFDTSGYPAAMVKAGISKDAQIVTLADHFDYLTRFVQGQAAMTPEEHFEKFRLGMLENGRNVMVDPELVKKVLGLFPKQ